MIQNLSSGTPGNGSSPSPTSISAAVDKVTDQVSSSIGTVGDKLSEAANNATQYASDVGDSVSRTARQMGESVASRVEELADSGADAASAVGGQVKTFASEIEAFGRKNPLGAIASALLVGVVIGMLGRRRN